MLHYYLAKLSVDVCCMVIDGGVECAMSALNVRICQILVALLLDRPITDGEVLKSQAVIMDCLFLPAVLLGCVSPVLIRHTYVKG